jgi:hypothetical protein
MDRLAYISTTMHKAAVLLLVLFLACKKDRQQGAVEKKVFEGVVLDYSTGQPIEGAAIDLYVTASAAYVTREPFDRLQHREDFHLTEPDSASTVSDHSGRFRMELATSENQVNYGFFYKATGYISLYDPLRIWKPVNGGAKDTLYMDKPTFVKYNIKRISTPSPNDTLILSRYFYSSTPPADNQVHTFAKYNILTGGRNNTTFVDTVSFKQFDKLTLWHKTGFLLPMSPTTYMGLTPFDTTEVILEY